MTRLPTSALLVLLSLLLLFLSLAINVNKTPVPIHALQFSPLSTGQSDLVVLHSDRAFHFPPDPNLELLRHETFGGSALRWTRSKLYADGHLRLELVWPGTGEVVETFDWQLDFGEVVQLVGLLVHSGFLESSERGIADQLRSRYEDLHFGPVSSHSAKTKLTLSLLQYRASGKRRMEPAGNSISLYAPSQLSRDYPGLPELDSFARVSEVFTGYSRQAIQSSD